MATWLRCSVRSRAAGPAAEMQRGKGGQAASSVLLHPVKKAASWQQQPVISSLKIDGNGLDLPNPCAAAGDRAAAVQRKQHIVVARKTAPPRFQPSQPKCAPARSSLGTSGFLARQ